MSVEQCIRIQEDSSLRVHQIWVSMMVVAEEIVLDFRIPGERKTAHDVTGGLDGELINVRLVFVSCRK